MPGIVAMAVGCNESGKLMLIGIDRDRSFREMFSNLTGSFREIIAAVPVRKSGKIESCYGNFHSKV